MALLGCIPAPAVCFYTMPCEVRRHFLTSTSNCDWRQLIVLCIAKKETLLGNHCVMKRVRMMDCRQRTL